MRKNQNGAKVLAMVAGGALVLSACSTADSGSDSTGSATTAEQTITAAWEQEFNAYNNQTGTNNATANSIVLNGVLTGFWGFGADGGIVENKDFGTYEKTSDNPLTVKYTINDKAVWSDGTPIDCDDVQLQWAATSNQFKNAGKNIFDPASTAGMEQTEPIACNKGDRSFELKYTKPFADWAAMLGGTDLMMPAHVVTKAAGLSEEDFIAAVKAKDATKLAKVAAFWNKGDFVAQPGTLNKAAMLSSGPYQLDSWQAGNSITLKANPKWWGEAPKASTVVIRTISGEQQAQALQNGEVQVISPQPQVDVVKQLEAIGSSVTVNKHDKYTYEHADYNFQGKFKDRKLREAFTLCMPRQQIIDNLIKPVNPDAKMLDMRYYFPFQKEYTDSVGQLDVAKYSKPDIAAAKKLVDEVSPGQKVTVRIGYRSPNPRRTNTVALIKSSCDQAGFTVQDAAQSDFFSNGLPNGNFDVALYAWAGSPLLSGTATTFVTGGGNNKGKYSNPEVDRLTAELNSETDSAKQVELVTQIEKILWEDLATIPMFVHPAVDAWSSNVEGVVPNFSQAEITWNMEEWHTKS